jgi:hypothetical protein
MSACAQTHPLSQGIVLAWGRQTVGVDNPFNPVDPATMIPQQSALRSIPWLSAIFSSKYFSSKYAATGNKVPIHFPSCIPS